MPNSSDRARDGVLRGFLPTRHDLAQLVSLAAPVALVQVVTMSMGAVDTVMVGRVSATDLAAVAIGNLYFFGVAIFGQGVLYALDPVIAQAVGALDRVGIARGVQRGCVLALGLTVLATLLMLPAAPFLTFAKQPADVVPVAAAYTRGLILGLFPFYLFLVFRQSLQAMSLVRPIVMTVILGNVVNVALNWVLIYGNLGMPAYGAVGSAWGTSLGRWFMVMVLLAIAWGRLRPALIPWRPEAFATKPLLRFLRVGGPIGAQQALEFGVFGAAGLLMGLLGTVAVAGHQVALQLAALTFMIPVGVAQATSVVVGQAVGRGDDAAARRAVGAGLGTATAVMTVTAALFLTVPGFLSRLFSADPRVVAYAAALLPIAGVFQVFDGLQVAAAGALRGIGDTRVPMFMNLLGFWMIGLPVSVGLGFQAGLGGAGVWWGLALGIAVVAILLTWRIHRSFGRTLTRLVIEEDAS